MMTFIIFFHLIVVSQRKKEENQGLINDILMLKIVMEKRLPRVHQHHHGSNITRPKTSAQQGFRCILNHVNLKFIKLENMIFQIFKSIFE
ncbi:unnamed protein product [Spirodela intermedia]|uniref:Uncharacterized protein n=1 Tax=Spirodela intermedia TaxID=51605 RepID=A0A7I8JL37_SPIIN|nr:unnamed protein product [Spirodela intermedia]CAA6670770.1 unnamed protein product [Spirodela intermedia]